jgi:hypothetical protein
MILKIIDLRIKIFQGLATRPTTTTTTTTTTTKQKLNPSSDNEPAINRPILKPLE